MSRKVSDNPQDWTEEDILYLHQYDQRADEVTARAEELGVTLPQPTGLGAPARLAGDLSDYSLDALFTHLEQRREQDPDGFEEATDAFAEKQEAIAAAAEASGARVTEYDGMTKDELREEITRRKIDQPASSATKDELIDVLVADDAE